MAQRQQQPRPKGKREPQVERGRAGKVATRVHVARGTKGPGEGPKHGDCRAQVVEHTLVAGAVRAACGPHHGQLRRAHEQQLGVAAEVKQQRRHKRQRQRTGQQLPQPTGARLVLWRAAICDRQNQRRDRHNDGDDPCALVRVEGGREHKRQRDEVAPRARAPAAQQQPDSCGPLERHNDRLDAHAAKVNVPAHDRQRDRGQQRKRRGQVAAWCCQTQLKRCAIDGQHAQRAKERRRHARERRPWPQPKEAAQPEAECVGICVEGRHTEVSLEKEGFVTGDGQDTPCLQPFERLIKMEAGGQRVDAPEAKGKGYTQHEEEKNGLCGGPRGAGFCVRHAEILAHAMGEPPVVACNTRSGPMRHCIGPLLYAAD